MRSHNGAVGYDKPIRNLLSFVTVFQALVLAVLDKFCAKELTPQPSVCVCVHEYMRVSLAQPDLEPPV